MKNTKKIFAAILAVMMIALMIPFTAAAVDTAGDSYTVTLDSTFVASDGKTQYRDGFTVSIYKIASLNTETGEYALTTDWADVEGVKAAMTAKAANGIDTKTLLACLDKVTGDALKNKTAADTWTIGKDATKKEFTVYKTPAEGQNGFGVYYIAWTGYPVSDTTTVEAFNNSVLSLPYYDNTGDSATSGWTAPADAITLGTKVNTGEPKVTKEFGAGTEDRVFTKSDGITKAITASVGENFDIPFILTGSVTGTDAVPSDTYELEDVYSSGITVNKDIAVTLTGGAKDVTLTADEDYFVTWGVGTFTVTLKAKALAAATDYDLETEGTQNFYSFKNVVVTYTGYLNKNAVENKGDANSVNLVYQQTGDAKEKTVPGDTVELYAFSLDVVKADAEHKDTKLGGAEFTIYNADGTTVYTNDMTTGTATTDKDGLATFEGLAAGTYVVKETKAPSGYNLNETPFTVVIANDGTITLNGTAITQLDVYDTLLVMPQTGGFGTIAFFIGGAALIVIAGVLFTVIKKKAD